MRTLDKIEKSRGILISTPEFRKSSKGYLYAVFKAEIGGEIFDVITSGYTLYYLRKANVGDKIIIHWKINKYHEFFATFIKKI